MPFCRLLVLFFCCFPLWMAHAQVVDSSTMTGKLLTGYQGWHSARNDGSLLGQWLYVHWGHDPWYPPSPSNTIHDVWADLSEFDSDELFQADFILGNGQPAKAYSCYKEKTVQRHFRWMKENNIDGAVVQRFIKDIQLTYPASWKELRNKNLQNAKLASETHGRVFCVMYDVSDADPVAFLSHLTNDWAELVTTLQITNTTRYLKHRGKPVVGLWGFGYDAPNKPFTPAQAQATIDWFKGAGCTVIGGVSTFWRPLGGDAQTDPAWTNVYASFDVISPWSVGRFGEVRGSGQANVDDWINNNVAPDLAYCNQRGIDYMPVVWPGYSSYNLNRGTSLNRFPRNGGRFYWDQIHSAIAAGATMLYAGMFDELEEATAIFKLAPTMAQTPSVSTSNPAQFFALDADGWSLKSDWYLRLSGEGAKMLRGTIPLSDTIPLLTVLPNGGETWTSGVPATVTWTTNGIPNLLSIELSTDGGGSWSRLVSGVTNSGAHSVQVPFIASTNCRVRLVAMDNLPSVYSRTNFAIFHHTNVYNFKPALETAWSLAPGSRSYVSFGGASVPLERSIAYNPVSNQVIIIHRTAATTGLTINVLDAGDGTHLHALKTTGITGGSVILIGSGVSDDGAVYAANMSTSTANSTSTLKLYRWANTHSNTTPVLIHTLTTPPEQVAGSHTNTFRFGDTLAVRGSGTNTQIILDEYFQGTNAAFFTPTESTLTQTWTATRFLTAYGKGTIGRSLQFGSGNTFWQKRKGDRLLQSSFDLQSGLCTVLTNATNFSASLGPVAVDMSRKLLAGINFTTSTSSPDTLDLYDISDLSAPQLIARRPFPIAHQANANFIGQVLFAGSRIFAINGNNGILVADISPPTQPRLTFAAIGPNFSISWTTQAVGFNLQRATNVNGGWTNVSQTPVIANGRKTVTDTNSGNLRFYRLLKP